MPGPAITLDVYARRGGVHGREFVGTAEVPSGTGEILEIVLIDGAMDRVAIGTRTVLLHGQEVRIERVIMLNRGQRPDLLPGWRPAADEAQPGARLPTAPVPIFSPSRVA